MSNIWHITHLELSVRIILAAVCGGVIGLEREWSNHAAGLRTHILVCIGSATIMLLSIYGFSTFVTEPNVRTDPARLAAQVVSGVGFLGAGAIMRNGSTVSGLTTAASIWVVAAIGLCVGAGFFYCAMLATLFVLLSLFVLNKWEKSMIRGRRHQEVVVKVVDRPGTLGRIATVFGSQGIQIVSISMRPEERELNAEEEPTMVVRFYLQAAGIDNMVKAFESISTTGDVISLDSGMWKKQAAGVVSSHMQ